MNSNHAMTTSSPTLAQFSAQCDSVFRVGAEGGAELVLSEAAALHQAPLDERRFSLLFRGPLQPQLAQATHLLEHAVFGELAMVLVPVGRDAAGMHHQAIFN